ncbi:hypothetical protein [Psychrobacter namhaensis]|uniref:hypothetical protein n=1 Tax=Psychrobacter namhaensis TaxID=292734 RepID=UPI0018DF5742|nr:hypothetical protein [Psychrobacter namhaensis]
MATSQTEIEQHIKRHGLKQLTNQDNTGLYCNSNHYSKKTKRIVIAQTSKWASKARSKGNATQVQVRANQKKDA